MAFPDPVPGLVIRYSYLWASEHARGQEEGVKDSAKRLKGVMMRISLGDDSAMAEVSAAVRSTAVTEAEDDE